jgi:hypothetical protein
MQLGSPVYDSATIGLGHQSQLAGQRFPRYLANPPDIASTYFTCRRAERPPVNSAQNQILLSFFLLLASF